MSRVTGLVFDLESQRWGGVSSAELFFVKTDEGGGWRTNMMIFVIAEKALNIIQLTFHEKISQTCHRRELSYLMTDSS